MRSTGAAITLSFVMLFPAIANAASCQSYINEIYARISHHYNKPNWLTLSSIQHALGTVQPVTSGDGKIQYKWVCPKDDSIFLSVTTNKDQVITTISGMHNDEEGGGTFDADMKDGRYEMRVVQLAMSECELPPAKRSCASYNVQLLAGENYICPVNYTVKDGYPPGGVSGPVCVMNSGADDTPNTCKDYHDPGCDPKAYQLACYGKWPCNQYFCYNYYNKWYVVQAIPVNQLCSK